MNFLFDDFDLIEVPWVVLGILYLVQIFKSILMEPGPLSINQVELVIIFIIDSLLIIVVFIGLSLSF